MVPTFLALADIYIVQYVLRMSQKISLCSSVRDYIWMSDTTHMQSLIIVNNSIEWVVLCVVNKGCTNWRNMPLQLLMHMIDCLFKHYRVRLWFTKENLGIWDSAWVTVMKVIRHDTGKLLWFLPYRSIWSIWGRIPALPRWWLSVR